MEDAVTQLHTEPRGKLKISAPPIIGALYIAPAVTEFLAMHKDLSVNLVLQSSVGDLEITFFYISSNNIFRQHN
jgi:DNA-binding transcriptional LysR family regulator